MGGDSTTEKYDVVLVATGRRPYTEGLGLENLGIQTDRLGRIQVDSHQFMPLEIASTINGYAGHVNYDAIPGVIYTFPEVAAVGKTEEELKEAGVQHNKGTFLLQANS
eukprot:scaffold4738_cov61-Cyclotella_meneghiniana.AAC.1